MASQENEANQANYDEIKGHLAIIKAKLTNHTITTEQRQSLAEDQEDYYERMLQLRIMQNQTQAEELKEASTKATLYRQWSQRLTVTLVAIVLLVLVGLVALFFPEVARGLVSNPWLHLVSSHALAAVVTTVIILKVKK